MTTQLEVTASRKKAVIESIPTADLPSEVIEIASDYPGAKMRWFALSIEGEKTHYLCKGCPDGEGHIVSIHIKSLYPKALKAKSLWNAVTELYPYL